MNGNTRIIAAVIMLAATIMATSSLAGSIQDSTTVPLSARHSAIDTSYMEEKQFVAPPAPDENSLEVRVFRLLNGKAANPALDFVMPIITDLKRSRIVLLVIWAFLVIFGGTRGRWVALMLIPLIAATDQLSASVLKPLVGRSRPCEVLGSVHLWHGLDGWITTPVEVIRSYKSSFSFPSSHATNITGAMLFLGLAFRKILWPLLFVALLVSYTRVYVGVHWTSDIIVGMAIGALLGWLAWIVFKKLYRTMINGSDDEDGTDGLLDDPGRGGPEQEISDSV